MFGNRRHFRELLAGSEEGIASNILADRLKRLVSAGLLTREDVGPGRRAAYSLTEASIQLVPVFAELGEWGLPTARPQSACACAQNCSQQAARRCGPNSWQSCGPSTSEPPRHNAPVLASANASPRHTPLHADFRRCGVLSCRPQLTRVPAVHSFEGTPRALARRPGLPPDVPDAEPLTCAPSADPSFEDIKLSRYPLAARRCGR